MGTQHIREGQKLSPNTLVELFTLDTSQLTNIYGVAGTGSIYNWTAGTLAGTPVVFAGVTYAPLPIAISGFEWNGQGKLPRPKMQIANISGLASGLVIEFGDMLGAIVTRQRTFAKFLDGQPNADTTAVYEADVFRIDRKSAQNKAYVEWELAAAFDQQNISLPRRQVLRDACSNTYRYYDGTSWHAGTCPYAGQNGMFDINNVSTVDPTLDSCSHRLAGCLARYTVGGVTQVVPFTGFPGVAQAPAT